MRFLLLAIGTFIFQFSLSGQALMSFQYPILEPATSFFEGNYDTALIRKNKVASCIQNNVSFYFDSYGRLEKSILIWQDSTRQVYSYFYDNKGDLIRTTETNSRSQTPNLITQHKTYQDGLLMKDSSSSGYLCKHMDYYDNGSLKEELWFGFDHRYNMLHRLHRGFWFGIDSAGNINRIIERDYLKTTDTSGQLVSNRTLYYNAKNQLIKEEEAVLRNEKFEKSLLCPNAGSATFFYNSEGRIIEIKRGDGPSQKIKYLPNGLMASIETFGKNCEGIPFHWQKAYTYTYRDQ